MFLSHTFAMPFGLCISPPNMVLEFQRAFHMETRRLLWLVGVVFATILLFQCVERPKDNTMWSMFSWGESSYEQRSLDFFSPNETANPVILSNISSPSIRNLSTMHEKTVRELKNNSLSVVSEVQDDRFAREPPQPIVHLENYTSESNSSVVTEPPTLNLSLPPLQNPNYILNVAEPPVEPPQIATYITNVPGETIEQTNSPAPTQSEWANKSSDAKVPLPAPSFPLPLSDSKVPLPAPSVPLPVSDSKVPLRTSSVPLPVSDATFPLPTPSPPLPEVKTKIELQQKEVLTLSDMNELLVQNQLSTTSMVPRWPLRADGEMVTAKSLIENAPLSTDGLYAPLYRNASMFRRSYELMEQMLKIYIYQEGDKQIFHRPPLQGIYASEGWFMRLLEANRHFVTRHPDEAHLFYLPFSSRQLEEVLYVPNSHRHNNLVQHLKNYRDMISSKYSFWNRTDGTDHFLVACHDWAPSETKKHLATTIRALCNADVKEGFKFGKDVSLPETYVRSPKNPLRDVGGKAASKRQTLAFYAGNMHGYLRPILLQYWGNNTDPDMKIFGKLPYSKNNRNYVEFMKSSKYCICPKGYEVNSPRVVEAIFYECVPVIISDNFVPPFFETLNWESFAVFVAEKDIPNLKNILLAIPDKSYFRMHMRVRKVQQHFLWHPKPVKYDLFHMILHSIWYTRVNQFRTR